MQYTQRTTGLSRFTSKTRFWHLLFASLLSVGFCCPLTLAQADSPAKPTAQEEPQAGQWYLVTGRNVNVRCAPNISGSYSMGKLQKGDRVFVTKESNGWASIKTTGPSFKNMYGLIRADNKVKESGNTVEALSSVPLLAPNVPAKNDPISSWKQLLSLKPGTKLNVKSGFDHATDQKTQRWLLVQLPETATVYMNMAFLTPEKPSVKEPTEPVAIAPVPEPTSTPSANTTETQEKTPDAKGATAETTTDSQATPEQSNTNNVTTAEETEKTDQSFDPADGSPMGAKVNHLDPLAEVSIDQAESAWKAMRNDGGADQEIETLQLIYVVIASNEKSTPEEKRIAELRIRQLEMQRQVQERLRRLQKMKQRNTVDRNRMQNAQILIEARAAYDAVGRINASRVYDGKRLPQLFRLQAPSGGRTLGYIRPSEQIDLMPMLGRLVGVVGPKNYDAGYRLMIVTPKRIDILTAVAED